MRKYIYLIISLLCCIILVSCKAPVKSSSDGPSSHPPKTVPVPEVVVVKKKQAPEDIKLVTAALIEKLRGGHIAVENVHFAQSGKHSVGESAFFYEDFEVHSTAITGYVVNVLDNGKAAVLLEGAFLFKDYINRRAGVYFVAQYTVSQSGVTITKSVTRGIPSDFPRVETFFVQESKLRAASATLKSYVDYYLFAIENAEPMTYAAGEAKTGITDKYVILAFSKDRLFQESKLSMVVSDKPLGAGKELDKALSINDSGWRILLVGGEFAPGSSANEFYVTVTYKQDPSTHLPDVVVGDYRNVKEKFVETPPQSVAPAATVSADDTLAPAPAPAPAPAQPSQQAATGPGPYEAGTAFLNPVFPEDVAIIQTRLKELGLYTYKIDSDWGPLTKKALNRFNVKHGFPKGQWSLDIQKTLFKGTGL